MRYICKNCKKVYYRQPAYQKKHGSKFGHFCSKSCYHEYRRKTYEKIRRHKGNYESN